MQGIYLAYAVSSYNKYIAFTYMLRILCVYSTYAKHMFTFILLILSLP